MPFTIEDPADARSDAPACEAIMRGLPDWFGIEESIVDYVRDVERMPTFVAADDGRVVGFLTINRHYEHAAEIQVMGVLADHHRQGVGRALVRRAEEWLRERGVEYLQVKTVGPSRECEHYARTREFYLAVGFRPLEEMKTLWNEANPCLVQVKKIT
jgi:GNAT superfamily N-acetyltransferase